MLTLRLREIGAALSAPVDPTSIADKWAMLGDSRIDDDVEIELAPDLIAERAAPMLRDLPTTPNT